MPINARTKARIDKAVGNRFTPEGTPKILQLIKQKYFHGKRETSPLTYKDDLTGTFKLAKDRFEAVKWGETCGFVPGQGSYTTAQRQQVIDFFTPILKKYFAGETSAVVPQEVPKAREIPETSSTPAKHGKRKRRTKEEMAAARAAGEGTKPPAKLRQGKKEKSKDAPGAFRFIGDPEVPVRSLPTGAEVKGVLIDQMYQILINISNQLTELVQLTRVDKANEQVKRAIREQRAEAKSLVPAAVATVQHPKPKLVEPVEEEDLDDRLERLMDKYDVSKQELKLSDEAKLSMAQLIADQFRGEHDRESCIMLFSDLFNFHRDEVMEDFDGLTMKQIRSIFIED